MESETARLRKLVKEPLANSIGGLVGIFMVLMILSMLIPSPWSLIAMFIVIVLTIIAWRMVLEYYKGKAQRIQSGLE